MHFFRRSRDHEIMRKYNLADFMHDMNLYVNISNIHSFMAVKCSVYNVYC